MGKKGKRRKPIKGSPDEQHRKLQRMGVVLIMNRREILIRIMDTAIMLWFEARDQVSIHILASVAHQNLEALGEAIEKAGPILKQTVPWEKLYSAYDSFRHSTGDPTHIDVFAPVCTQALLTDCVVSFHEIFDHRTPWMNTFGSYCTLSDRRINDPSGEFYEGVRVDEVAKLSRQAFVAKMLPLFIEAHKRGFH